MDAREQNTKQQKAAEDAVGDRLWAFAIEFYARPGVAATCLWLQDLHTVDTNILLFSLWAAYGGHELSSASLAAACSRCEDWRSAVVLPLRNQRRRWKSSPAHRSEYAAIKTLELAAERAQLNFLAAMLHPWGESPGESNAKSNAQTVCTEGVASRLTVNLTALSQHYALPEDVRQRLLADLGQRVHDST